MLKVQYVISLVNKELITLKHIYTYNKRTQVDIGNLNKKSS